VTQKTLSKDTLQLGTRVGVGWGTETAPTMPAAKVGSSTVRMTVPTRLAPALPPLPVPKRAPLVPPAAKPAPPAPPEAPHKAGPFRDNALRARVVEAPIEALPAITGGRFALLGFLTTALFTLLLIGYFGRVEVTSVAPGALVVRGGPRPVLTQASGQVTELQVKAGERVSPGQQIARIDATELVAREQRQKEQLSLLRAEHERQTAAKTTLYERGVSALVQKRALLAQRSNLKRVAVGDRSKRAKQVATLANEGAASQNDALVARDSARTSQEELLLLRQQLADIDLELSDRKRVFDSEMDASARQLKEAQASLDEAQSLIALSFVRAPVGGRVESLLVTAGQVVSAGSALARIIPDGTLSTVVVFAPAKDAAFLNAKLQASVEFASLPVSEFGKSKARVTRVSGDVATREEVAAVLGAVTDEAVIRVELELIPSPTLEKVSDRLRSGERLTARLNTRERRIITLLFDFLRKWYPT
jgi:membrane fusion protein